ncbi:hypothetical protein ACSQ67_017091 [Phaseolus vulgaris]
MGGDGKDAEDDLTFNDDTSTWKESANAAGAGKPLTYPRQQTRLKRAATFKLASTRVKGKEVIAVDDEELKIRKTKISTTPAAVMKTIGLNL